MDALELKYSHKGNVNQQLEVMKNNLFGRLQYPHPYFIEKGVHSISILAHQDSAKSKALAEKEQIN